MLRLSPLPPPTHPPLLIYKVGLELTKLSDREIGQDHKAYNNVSKLGKSKSGLIALDPKRFILNVD